MDNKQLIIIFLAIIIAGLIISVGCFYGLSQNKNTANNITNTTNTTNTTNSTNTTNTSVSVEPISSESSSSSESKSYSKPQYIGEDGQPVSEADYKTWKVYGKSADSPEEYAAQKASLGYKKIIA